MLLLFLLDYSSFDHGYLPLSHRFLLPSFADYLNPSCDFIPGLMPRMTLDLQQLAAALELGSLISHLCCFYWISSSSILTACCDRWCSTGLWDRCPKILQRSWFGHLRSLCCLIENAFGLGILHLGISAPNFIAAYSLVGQSWVVRWCTMNSRSLLHYCLRWRKWMIIPKGRQSTNVSLQQASEVTSIDLIWLKILQSMPSLSLHPIHQLPRAHQS